MEANSGVSQEKSPKYLRMVGEQLNSESIGKQFDQEDVYDGTESILNRNRAPGSRAKGKHNARDSKGARRKGQREVNWEGSIDNPGGSDNSQDQEVFGNAGEGN